MWPVPKMFWIEVQSPGAPSVSPSPSVDMMATSRSPWTVPEGMVALMLETLPFVTVTEWVSTTGPWSGVAL